MTQTSKLVETRPVKALLLVATLAVSVSVLADKKSVYDIPLKDIDNKAASLKAHKGKVMLIVNVASACGLTPQYKQLQSVYQKYGSKGFTVCGFPCNQFGNQEASDADTIGSFCTSRYDVTFPMFAKTEVNGRKTHPLFAKLKADARGVLGSLSIKWNFTKFLVDRDGKVLKRYAPTIPPDAIKADIEGLLGL